MGDAAAVSLPGIGRLRKGCGGGAGPFGFGFDFGLQRLSLGRNAGLVEWVTRQDAMTGKAYGGRVGRFVKAGVVGYIVRALR